MAKKNTFMLVFLVLAAAAAGMALVIYATSIGPGIGGDATIYLTSARNLIAGKGLGWTDADGSFRLLPYFPPFYPLALGAVGLFVKDMVVGARWLNVLLFGATIFITGWSFYRYTRRVWLSAILAGVLATSPVILGVQVWAMSESIFLFLNAAGLVLLLEYFARPRWYYLLGSSVLCGLAFLTRYIGVACVATGCLALLLLYQEQDGRIRLNLSWPRLRIAFVYGLVAVLPTLAWLVIDFSLTGTVGSRSGQPVSAYWNRFLEIGPALQQIYLFWLLPDSYIPRLPGVLKIALWLVPVIVLAALAVALAWRASSLAKLSAPSDPIEEPVSAASIRLAVLFGLFIIVFLVVLAVVQVFTYPPITLASRMLSPVHYAVIVLVFALLHLALRLLVPLACAAARVIMAVVYLGCLAFLAVYGVRGSAQARGSHGGGIGYMSPAWLESGTIAQLRSLPADIPLISNETTAIMFFENRPAYAVQEIYQDHPQPTFSVYGSGDDPAQRAFREKGAALVLFTGNLGDDFAMYGDQAGARIKALTQGLYLYYQGEDGAIYFYKQPGFVTYESCG